MSVDIAGVEESGKNERNNRSFQPTLWLSSAVEVNSTTSGKNGRNSRSFQPTLWLSSAIEVVESSTPTMSGRQVGDALFPSF